MRRATPLRSIAALSPLWLAACGLETTGLDRVLEVPDGAATSTTGTDAPPPPRTDAYVTPSPPTSDAATPPPPPPPTSDASSPPDAPVPPACDSDGDGHAAIGGCGGDDCCDTDARAHPGVTAYFDSADACNTFDYDCNGSEDPQYGTANCQLDFFGGSCGGDGFAAATPCGQSGTYTSCSYAVFGCNTSNSDRVQGCR